MKMWKTKMWDMKYESEKFLESEKCGAAEVESPRMADAAFQQNWINFHKCGSYREKGGNSCSSVENLEKYSQISGARYCSRNSFLAALVSFVTSPAIVWVCVCFCPCLCHNILIIVWSKKGKLFWMWNAIKSPVTSPDKEGLSSCKRLISSCFLLMVIRSNATFHQITPKTILRRKAVKANQN